MKTDMSCSLYMKGRFRLCVHGGVHDNCMVLYSRWSLGTCTVVIVLMELRAGTDGAQYLCVLLFAGRILSTASA